MAQRILLRVLSRFTRSETASELKISLLQFSINSRNFCLFCTELFNLTWFELISRRFGKLSAFGVQASPTLNHNLKKGPVSIYLDNYNPEQQLFLVLYALNVSGSFSILFFMLKRMKVLESKLKFHYKILVCTGQMYI